MPGLSWSPAALADLRRIDIWLAENASASVADQMLGAIRGRAMRLEGFPMIGRQLLNRGYRVLTMPGTPSLMIYRIERETIQILRLRHQREDRAAGS
jgi:plasmid stabilization system protein ParE